MKGLDPAITVNGNFRIGYIFTRFDLMNIKDDVALNLTVRRKESIGEDKKRGCAENFYTASFCFNYLIIIQNNQQIK